MSLEIYNEQMPKLNNSKDKGTEIFQRIIDSLELLNISFKIINHQPVYTMEEAQAATESSPEQGVKVLFVRVYTTKSKYNYALVVWTGNKLLDFKKIAQALEVKKTKLATEDEVLENLGIEIGSLTPIGYDQGYQTIIDKSLLDQEMLYINPGLHNKTIMLEPEGLMKLFNHFNSTNDAIIV